MCGLCLPHCPTYGLLRDEAESPRGRISLIKGWAEGKVAPSVSLTEHLDHCLACRNCESACPAQVRYGELIDHARAAMKHRPPKTSWLASNPTRRLAEHALRLYQLSGAQRVARGSGALRLLGLARADAALPALETVRLKNFYPATGARQGQVGLFTGCATAVFDRITLNAAAKALTRCGFDVHVPRAQACCGSLHQHAGELETAQRLIAANRKAFTTLHLDAVVTVASGCGAQLAEKSELPVRDISDFLVGAWRENLTLEPLAKTAAVHNPCTLRNVLHRAEAPYALLRRIPQFKASPLPRNEVCCGGAGEYILNQAAMADALRSPKLAALANGSPDMLLTSNIGCALHLRAGVVQAGLEMEVLHPVTLIARQLPD